MVNKTTCRLKGCRRSGDNWCDGYCCREHYDKDFKEYSKGKVIRQFFKQKLYEVGIIPTGLAALIFIPYWIGILLINKILNMDLESYCEWAWASPEYIPNCINTGDVVSIWFIGLLTLIIIGAFIYFNWSYAKDKVKERFANLGADE